MNKGTHFIGQPICVIIYCCGYKNMEFYAKRQYGYSHETAKHTSIYLFFLNF